MLGCRLEVVKHVLFVGERAGFPPADAVLPSAPAGARPQGPDQPRPCVEREKVWGLVVQDSKAAQSGCRSRLLLSDGSESLDDRIIIYGK